MSTDARASARNPFAVLAAAVAAVLVLLFVYSVADVLLLLLVAALFSLYLGAITDFLERRARVPRPAGLTVALVLTLLLALAVGWMIVPPVLRQTQELVQALPAEMARWAAGLRDLSVRYPLLGQLLPPDVLERQLTDYAGQAGTVVGNLVPYLFSTVNSVIHGISVLVMGVFLALRPAMYREGVISLAPPVHRELVRDVLADLARTLRAWIGGQILAMFFLGGITWIGLQLLDVPFALAFAVFTGVVVMVPFFGTLVSTILPALFVLGTGGIVHALLVILLGVVVHVVEANLVHPLIMERRVKLPPVLSILSVLIMAELLGLIGLLVAVPVLASTMVIVRRLYVHRLLEGKGFRRFVRDAPAEVRLPEGALRLPPGALSIPGVLEDAGLAPR